MEGGRGKGGGGVEEESGGRILVFLFYCIVDSRITSTRASIPRFKVFFKIIKVKKDWAKSGQTFKSMEGGVCGGDGPCSADSLRKNADLVVRNAARAMEFARIG